MGNLGKSIRLWLIQRFLGPEAVGIYAVAIGLIGHTIALVPLHTVISPLLPQFVHDRDRLTRLLNKGIQYQLAGYLAVGTVAFFLFPPILGWLFPDYMRAFPLFQIMLLALIPGAVVSIVNPVYSALKMQKSLFFSMMFKTVLTTVFTYLGILFFGVWGIALESIVTGIVQTTERVWSLRRHIPGLVIHPGHFFRFDDDDRMLLGKMRGYAVRNIPGAKRYFSI